MTEEKKKNNVRAWLLRILLIVYDIIAVNFAYCLTILVRFYVNHEFLAQGDVYMRYYLQFAPYYTICCIIIFAVCGLYSNIWKYADVNDIRKIIVANIITCLINVVGTILIVERMPITFYVIGAIIQFALILLSRFAYRILHVEVTKRAKAKGEVMIPTMVVGIGESSRTFLRLVSESKDTLVEPKCVCDYRSSVTGTFFCGLPVVGPGKEFSDAVKRFDIQNIIIADPMLSMDARREIAAFCKVLSVEMRDFSGIVHYFDSCVTIQELLEHIIGPVVILAGDERKSFETPTQAAAELPGYYLVRTIKVEDNTPVIEIGVDATTGERFDRWIKEYEKESE